VRAREPKFFYFSSYETLPGRIALSDLGGQEEEPGASEIPTAKALLALAGTTATALSAEDFEDRKAELEAVSNDLTRQVFTYWNQNPDLSVVIDLDKTTVQAPNGQQAVASHLDIRVRDTRHEFTNNFSARSSGFQWFFSFLAAFSAFENYSHGVVVLLDEPGLSLHGRAQADFLRFINERLAPTAQVIYTTHSPFMVETARLDRVRIVEDRGVEFGSLVTDEVLGVTDDSLFPLQAALGYDIAQNLFVGPDNLLVEGTSDFTYLTLISDLLKDTERTHLDERWRILPAGGATNIPAFVALIGKNLDATVLIDGTPAGVTKIKNLTGKGLLAPARLLIVDTYSGIGESDIEDLFAPEDYLTLYNAAFRTTLQVSDLNGSDRIISRITRATGTQFKEHGRPSDALLRNRDTLLPELSEITLSRFEQLFTDINSTLRVVP
jgi:predicted ATP-dependent endonuclease of OLD family